MYTLGAKNPKASYNRTIPISVTLKAKLLMSDANKRILTIQITNNVVWNKDISNEKDT